MKREHIDLHLVPDHQLAMHSRLINWSRWCRGRPASNCAPMFRGYRSSDVWQTVSIGEPVDKLDASKIASAVAQLPETHRHALGWHYVHPIGPGRAARELGLTIAALAQCVIDGRQMLINRRA